MNLDEEVATPRTDAAIKFRPSQGLYWVEPNDFRNMEREAVRLARQRDALLRELKDAIKCIRRGDLGDYSPMMDEIFDSEHAIEQVEQMIKKYERK